MRILALISLLGFTACNPLVANPTTSTSYSGVPPNTPSGISLVTPATSPGNNPTPTLQVSGLASGEAVSIFPNSSCTNGTSLVSGLASGNTLNLTTSALTDGATYTFYAQSSNSAGPSPCSSVSVQYTFTTGSMIFSSASVPAAGTTVVVEIGNVGVSPITPSSGITGFSIAVNSTAATVSSATRTGNTEVTLTLTTLISSTDTVTVSYTPGNLTDSSATTDPLAAFTNQAVTNNSIGDPDVDAYYNAIIANSGTISSTTLTAIKNLVSGLKTDGLWSELTEIYPIAGNQLAAAFVKLKVATGSPTTITNYNFIGTDYNETGASGGLQGDGSTKYLDTGLSIPALNQNSISVGGYVVQDSTTATDAGCIIGSSYAPTGNYNRFYIFGSGYLYEGEVGIGALYTGDIATGVGLRTMSYDGSNVDVYADATAVSTNPGESGLIWQQSGTVLMFADNNGGSELHNGVIAFGFVGSGLSDSDMSSLYSLVQTFETALSRDVP